MLNYDESGRPIVTSEEEKNEIYALPKQTIRFHGEEKTGHFDAKARVFYILNEEEKWTGQYIKLKAPAPSSAPSGKTEESEPRPDPKPEEKPTEKVVPPKQEKNQNGKSSGSPALFIVSLIMLLAAFGILVFSLFDPLGLKKETVTEQPAASEEISGVTVMAATEELIPGTMLTEDMVQPVSISLEIYNSINIAGSSSLCMWDDAGSVIGKYVVTYVPAGQYLLYDNVGSSFTADNPFIQGEGTLITLPSDLTGIADLCIGEILSYTVTYSKTNADGTQTTATATWDLTVCDLYNIEGTSLSELAGPYLGMYDSALKTYMQRGIQDGSFSLESYAPEKALVYITEEQLDEIGGSLDAATQTEVTRTNRYTADNLSYQRKMFDFFGAMRSFLDQ